MAVLALLAAACSSGGPDEAGRETPSASAAPASVAVRPHPGTGRIAFTSDPDELRLFDPENDTDIYVLDVNTPKRRMRLTTAPGNDFDPDWSPDGTKIVFRSSRVGNDEIYVMEADGSHQRRLTEHVTENHDDDRSATWSPDGKRIAWAALEEYGGGLYLWVMNADGSGKRKLSRGADDEYPSWSPDGRQIAFHSGRDGNWEIYVMNADGSNPRRLTRNPGEDTHPAWSPDGEKIAFSSERGGRTDIYVMRADGTGLTRLTRHPGADYLPSWSPDGSQIAFDSDRAVTQAERDRLPWDVPAPYQLYVMDADGSRAKRLTAGAGSNLLSDWQP